jgi:hypothetical protein
MSKSLIIGGAAFVAATVASLAAPTVAQAGKHFGGGGGKHHHHHHHHRHHRRIIVTPVYTETYKVKRPTTVVQEKKIVVTYADGQGRRYDAASKAWFDGKDQCWSGKLAWTFKNGAWSYGSYRWSQTNGMWRTNAPEAPATVDCSTIPAFAAKPTTTAGGYADQGEPIETKAAPGAPPVLTGEKKPGSDVAKAGECKKYFPTVGEMLAVPCKD